MTTPWAEARVEAELDYGNIDTELRTRLVQSVQLASKQIQREFDEIRRRASLRATQTAREWEDAFQRIRLDAQRTGQQMTNALRVQASVDVDQASINAARARLNTALQDVTVRVTLDEGNSAATVRASHAHLQTWLDANPLTVRLTVDSTAVMGDMHAAHAALQAWLAANPLRVRVDVDQNHIGQLTRSLGGGNNGLLSMFSKVGKAVGGAVGTLAKWTAIAGLGTVAVTGMLPAVATLGAAIGAVGVAAGGAGVAGISAMIAAGATLKVAFSGVGDALKNAFDPANADKFNQAMAKLSPQAQSAVLAIQGINQAWKDSGAQLAVQDALFSGLGDKLSSLATKMMPAVRESMLTVADGFNEGATSALNFTNSSTGIGQLQDILAGSSNMAANFGAALGNLVPGLVAIGSGAANAFSPLTDGIGGATRNLSAMLVKAQQSGQITAFFERALTVARQFGAVLQQVGGILAAVGSAAAAVGNGNALGGLTDRLREVNAFFSAGEGRAALIGYFGAMQSAVGSVLPILMNVAGIIGKTVAPAIAGLITQIAPSINHLVGMLGEGLAAMAPAMAPLGAAINSIASALAPAMPVLGQLINQIVQFAGPIIGALAAALGPVLTTVGNALMSMLSALQPAIAPVGAALLALGPVIQQVAQFLGTFATTYLSTLFVPAVRLLATTIRVLSPVLQGLMQMLQPLAPVLGVVAAAVVAAIAAFKVFGAVKSIITGVRTAWMLLSLAFSISPLGLIITAVAALAAGLALFFTKTETGRRIWDAIWNGIKATFTAVWNVIKAAWDAVWPVLEKGLHAIGDVVSWVADHWKVLLAVLTGPIGIIIGLAAKFGILQAVFRAVGTAATWLWQNAIQPAFSVIGTIIGAVVNAVQGYFNAWMAVFQAVGQAIMWFWNTVVTPAFAAIGAVISAWWGVVSGVFNFFISLIGTIGSAIAGFVSSAISWFANLASTVWATVSGWVSNMWASVSGFVSNVVGAISGFVGEIIGFFTNLASGVWNAVVQMWNTVRDGFTTGISTAVNLVTGMKDKIVGFFAGAGSWLINAGKSIIQGIVDGIRSMAGAIGNAILNMIPSPVRGAVKSALGLWVGGMIPAYRSGGMMGLARFAGGGQQDSTSTQNIGQPGSFIVNANATREYLPLLRRIAPSGKVISGPGNGTSDSITAMWGGRPRARVSNGEYWVPAAVAQRILPLLTAINQGAQLAPSLLALLGGDYDGGLSAVGIEEDNPAVGAILDGGRAARDQTRSASRTGRSLFNLVAAGNYDGALSSMWGIEEDHPLVGAVLDARKRLGLKALADGGVISKLLTSAKQILNSRYAWGGRGNGWNTDCSGAASNIANLAVGKSDPGMGERTATGGMGEFLKARGFQPGMGGPNDVSIGWSAEHAASTIAGTNVEHTGPEGAPGKYGAGASGADSLPNKMHLPMEGDPSGTAGAVPTGSTPSLGSSSSSTPIGSGISSSGGSSSWGNSGGGSKYNSAEEADKAGVTPVWVENWPATMGGGAGSSVPTTTPIDQATPAAATPSGADTIPLKKNPDGTYSSTDPEWNKLIQRESGGKADIVQQVQDVNSGGNEASGLFQIAKGTWKSYGGTQFAPTAGEATPEQQAEIAAKIFNKEGGRPWGSGLAGRESDDALRAGIQHGSTVPTTPQGTVPVTVTNGVDPTNPAVPSTTPTDQATPSASQTAAVEEAETALKLAEQKLTEAQNREITAKTEKAREKQEAAKQKAIEAAQANVDEARTKLERARQGAQIGEVGATASNEAKARQRAQQAHLAAEKAADGVREAEEKLARVRNDPTSKPSDITAAELALQRARNAAAQAADRAKTADAAIAKAREKDAKKAQTQTPTTPATPTTPTTGTPTTTEQQDRFKVQDTISATAGGYVDTALQQGIDAFLKDHKGLLGGYDNSTAKTSLGKRVGSVASTAISGQLSSALGIFGIDSTPPILQAISQYDQDNQGGDRKTLVDLANDLAKAAWEAGSTTVVVHGGVADPDDIVNKVNNDRRRRMRRYVK